MNIITLTLANGVWADAGEVPVVSVAFDWPIIVGMIVSVVLPLLVGLATTRITASGVRATVLALLAAVTGLLTELGNALTAGVTYNLGMGLVFALASFLVAVGMHFGIYKPTGASTAAQNALGGDKALPPGSAS
ncbi:membrane protein [Microbacterium phage NoodlelyBoi]|uniref:Membrane protein n=1 Tax=Microbacterium phage NoodlelyBoi TaxID=2813165 RepID=A0A899IS86_9CAUD|nr:membrane protein [Microbacterium phage NoodlelyBoi]QSM01241.1 membrane protein [Microbacterium phage NoodlelyBoi]